MKKRGLLRIELMSSLCAGSGYAYGGIIDSDVCFDEYGIPYIPARRLKGCLKDAAELIAAHPAVGEERIRKLFGVPGADSMPSLIVEDANIENKKEIEEPLKQLKKDEKLLPYIERQNILKQFTYVVGQTRLEQGVAAKETLRFTRAVNRNNPFEKGRHLVFFSTMLYEVEDEEALSMIVKAVRHIGMKRSRGFGNVKCSLIGAELPETVLSTPEAGEEDGFISLTLNNMLPLMISNGNDRCSETYIPGTNLRGALAAQYISAFGKDSAESEEFRDLFLTGKVLYSNLYPVANGSRSIPCPLFINRLKKTKTLVNILRSSEAGKDRVSADPRKNSQDHRMDNGNQPKKLKGKYLTVLQDKEKTEYSVCEADQVINYHHRRDGKAENGGLYTQQAVRQGQTFGGEIHFLVGSKEERQKLMKNVLALLKDADLRFGKSKSAQYGACEITDISIKKEPEEKHFKKGDAVLVSMASPGVFLGEYDYTVNFREVSKLIADELGLSGKAKMPWESATGESPLLSTVDTELVWGYQTKWNLKQPPFPVISAGSTFVFCMNEDTSIKAGHIGEKTQEGFGEIRLFSLNTLPYELPERSAHHFISASDNNSEEGSGVYDANRSPVGKILLGQLETALITKVMDAAQNMSRLKMSASTLGRVSLMLTECVQGFSGEGPEFVFREFVKRVCSIKRDAERLEAVRILENTVAEKNADDAKELRLSGQVICSFMQGENTIETKEIEEINLMEKYLGITRDQVFHILESHWAEILSTLFVSQKYKKKTGGGGAV